MLRNINFRVSVDDRIAFEQLADELGITRSRLFRTLIACAARGRITKDEISATRIITIDPRTWSEISTESRRWGNNFNQGVKALNTLALRFQTTELDAHALKEVGEQIAIAEEHFSKASRGIHRVADAADAAAGLSLKVA